MSREAMRQWLTIGFVLLGICLFRYKWPPWQISISFPGPGTSHSTGGGGTFLHHRSLTIDHTQAGGSTLTGFPVLVSATLGSSRIQNASCFDVVFTSDSGGTAKIPWEMETCNQNTGAIVAWVNVASVSGSADTVFYVFYDNAGVSAAQNAGANGSTHVWPSNYKGVYHLGTSSALSLTDSTSNGATLSNFNGSTPGAGEINGAAAFTGASMFLLENGGVTTLPANGNVTLSWWELTSTGSTTGGVFWGSSGQGTYNPYSDGTLYWDDGGRVTAAYGAFYGAWTYIVITCKSDGTAQSIIVNGVLTATAANACLANAQSSFELSSRGVDWSVDEARIQTTVDTNVVGISLAEYNNQKSGSTFLTLGAEI
jgi:hypothetical protein